MKYVLSKCGLVMTPLFFFSCATYEQPEQNAPHATVNFIESYNSFVYAAKHQSQGHHQVYQLISDNNCDNPVPAVEFHSGALDGKVKSKRVPPDAKISIVSSITIKDASLSAYTTGGGEVLTANCFSYIAFTPENGASYDVKMISNANQECELSILDKTTNKPPKNVLIGRSKVCPNYSF